MPFVFAFLISFFTNFFEMEKEEESFSMYNACETYDGFQTAKGIKYKRNAIPLTEKDKNRIKKIIRLVSYEMGASPVMPFILAKRESDFDPYAAHVLLGDVVAARSLWEKFLWKKNVAVSLKTTMRKHGALQASYWEAKAVLDKKQIYKNNPFYHVKYPIMIHTREGLSVEKRNVWWMGYGLYGMTPTPYIQYWNSKSPPWVLCQDDGAVATIVLIWALRNQLTECKKLGYKASYVVLNRRYSAGHCDARPKRAHLFLKRARRAGLNPHSRPRLGNRWKAHETVREEILHYMRKRIQDECLTKTLYKNNKCTNVDAVGY